MKKIIVLAGGNDQIRLIGELKKYYRTDIKIILIDYLNDPPAKPYADIHYQISTLDLQSVLSIAQKESIHLIITACTDQALLTMAYVSEVMNLPCYLTYGQAKEFINKKYMKMYMNVGGILTASYKILHDIDTYQSLDLPFPLVVKPIDSNSSKGISKVSNSHDLYGACKEAYNYSRSKEILVEEYINGKEISADIFINNGQAKVLLITETIKLKKDERFLIIQSNYIKTFQDELKTKIEKIAQKICELYEISAGPMIIQLLQRNNELYVIEFSARTGGGNKVDIIEQITGINVIGQLLNVINKKQVCLEYSSSSLYYSMYYVYCSAKTFEEVIGIDELKKEEVIHNYYVYKSRKTRIEKNYSSTDRVLGFLVKGESPEEVKIKRAQVESRLKIIDSYNNDIMVRGIYD